MKLAGSPVPRCYLYLCVPLSWSRSVVKSSRGVDVSSHDSIDWFNCEMISHWIQICRLSHICCRFGARSTRCLADSHAATMTCCPHACNALPAMILYAISCLI